MGLWTLFVTASIPVLETVLITALGSYLALDRVNLLGEDSRKHLNSIVFYIFSPSLVGTKLAETITYESMMKLWFMPINILFTYIVGSILGWALIRLAKPPPHLRGLVVGCCAAGNLGNILLILVPAVCEQSGSPFGDADTCDTNGVAYVSLSMAMGAIYLWTYVYNIVRISSNTSTPESTQPSETVPLLTSIEEDNVDHYALAISEGEAKKTCLGKIKNWLVMVDKKLNLKAVFAPSTIAAIAGFVIGLIPQIRNLLIGDDAPLVVIDDCTSLLGNAAIPLLTLIVGGNLVKGLRVSGIQKSIIAGIVVVRYVALPLTGILIVKLALKLGFVTDDPLYLFVLLLQFSVPPAMNIGTITQLFGQGESECSVIMLWTYIFASVSLTFWSALFMWLVA